MKTNVRPENTRRTHNQNNNMKETRNMKTKNYVFALVACCAIGASSAQGQTYSVTDLGYLPNKKEAVSTAGAINNSGLVAGTSGGAAFLYSKEMKEVGQNPDGLSRGFGIDPFGQVVGDSTFAKGGPNYAALFSKGEAYYLGDGTVQPGQWHQCVRPGGRLFRQEVRW